MALSLGQRAHYLRIAQKALIYQTQEASLWVHNLWDPLPMEGSTLRDTVPDEIHLQVFFLPDLIYPDKQACLISEQLPLGENEAEVIYCQLPLLQLISFVYEGFSE